MSLPAIRRTIAGIALVVAWLPSTSPVAAFNPERGKQLVRTNCARCHAIGKSGQSPLAIAPPFRSLHERYPVETLQEALAEGIVTGHPDMPEFRFAADEVGDIIAFLKTLERRAAGSAN
jgi:mono/diheme cytochrome c family protein